MLKQEKKERKKMKNESECNSAMTHPNLKEMQVLANNINYFAKCLSFVGTSAPWKHQMRHMVCFWKLHFLLAPYSPLTLNFFLFEKILLNYKGGQSNPAGWGYFGHLHETWLKSGF